MRKLKKEILFAITIICVLIFSWLGSMYWVTGELEHWKIGKKYSLDFQDTKDVSYEIKRLKQKNQSTFKSISNDGYVIANFSKAAKVKDVVLDVSFKKKSKNTSCQIFYAAASKDFSEENSVLKKIKSGKNVIQIEDGYYDKIRIDFTDEEGVKFTVNSLALYEDYIPTDIIWMFFSVSIILIVIAYMYFYKDKIKISAFRKVMQKWQNIPERNRKLIGVLGMSSITLLIVLSRIYYNGNIYAYSDIGSDSMMQYLPQYNLIINKLSNGTFSTWLPEVGYGYNIGYFFLCSPLLLLLFLVGTVLGTQYIPILVIAYKVVGILLCAYVAFKFLELFTDNYNVVAIGAYLYAFNGFIIVWGQHYVFFDYPLYAILVFYCIEKFLRAKNKKFYLPLILISFACMIFSVYMAYMIYVPAAVYAIMRYIYLTDKFQWKKFMESMSHLALNIIIGFVGGMSLGLLYTKNILLSGRTGAESSKMAEFLEAIKHSYFEDGLFASLQRFVSANLSGIGNYHEGLHNYYEEPQLFLSVILILVLFQFVFTAHKVSNNKKQWICKYIAVVLLGYAMFNKGILIALYAFSDDSRRTTFAFFPMLAVMMVIVLDNIFRKKILSKWGLVLGGIVTAVLTLYNVNSFASTEKTILIVVSLAVMILAIIIFWMVSNNKATTLNSAYILILGLALFINVTTEMYTSVNRVGLMRSEMINEKGIKSDTREAVEYIKEKDVSYYRTDMTYAAWNGLTDSFYATYNPVTTYNSVMSNYSKEYNEEYMNPLYVSTRYYKPTFKLSQNDIVQYSSLGLKYVLSDRQLPEYNHYNLIKQIGDVYIYENLAASSFTTFFDDVVLKSEFMKLGYIDKNKIQQKAIVIDDEDANEFEGRVKSVGQVLEEFESVDLTEYIMVEGQTVEQILNTERNEHIEFIFSKDWDGIIHGNVFMEMAIKPATDGTLKIYYDTGRGYNTEERYLMSCSEETSQMRYVLPKDVKSIRVDFGELPSELLDFKIVESIDDIKISDNKSVLSEGKNSSYINGKITCDRDGMLYIPIPYDSGWKVRIDDKEVNTYVANSGFMAINISKGDHTINMRYAPDEIKIGLICLGVAILMSAVYYILCKRFDKTKNI